MKYKPTLDADELLKLQEGRLPKRPRTTSILKTFAEEDVYEPPASPHPHEDLVDSDADDSEEQLSSEDEHHWHDSPHQLESPYAFEDRGRMNFSIAREIKAKGDLPSSSRANATRSFAEMGVAHPLHAALARMSIRVPTEVQAACIPPLLAGLFYTTYSLRKLTGGLLLGRDCIGNAKTGSGKTIAFAIPILQKLSEDPYGIFALVLTPTRFA
jgi:ATP-dependent RNA helicase DDX49/DBP8